MPDISFVIGQLNKQNANPRKGHLWVAKRVVRYLKRTIKMGLIFGWKSVEWLPKDLLLYRLIGYINSNFAEDPKDWKSVMAYCLFLNRTVIS